MAGAPLFSPHASKVRSLYKRALRNLEAWYDRREAYRFQAVVLRDRFDQNSKLTDMRQAENLVKEGESELFKNIHYQPQQFATSPGGVAFGRDVIPPDWLLDYWHPMEKAQYPDYFERREKRKQQYVEWWQKQYGPPSHDDLHGGH